MTFQLVAGWGDSSVNGTVRVVSQPGNQVVGIFAIVNGELRSSNNQVRGIPLDARPGTTYVIYFDVLNQGGQNVALNPIAIPACSDGSVNDLGAMSGNANLNTTKKH
jgi:hypothetical protein